MKSFYASLQAFFFREQTALGFGLMRISWAVVAGLFFLAQWKDIGYFYSNTGIISPEMLPYVTRSVYDYTVLSWVTNSDAVFSLYILMLVCMASMALGIFPRIMTIASVLLLISFDERDPMVLGGGDTLLRDIGFILMIAPNLDALSLKRYAQKKESPKKKLSKSAMAIWPYRLLLWQMIILYITSFWYKLLGNMWIQGTAVQVTLHHPTFSRWPMWFNDLLMPILPAIDWITLWWEGLWLLLLVPRFIVDLLPPQLQRIPLKRILMIIGIFFHGGIFILMDAGSFSLVMFTAYFGLLQDEDFAWIRRLVRKR